MTERLLPYPLLADPDGEVCRNYGVWDEEGGIALPAVFVVDCIGIVRYAFVSEDLADRPDDEELLTALRALAVRGEPDEG